MTSSMHWTTSIMNAGEVIGDAEDTKMGNVSPEAAAVLVLATVLCHVGEAICLAIEEK